MKKCYAWIRLGDKEYVTCFRINNGDARYNNKTGLFYDPWGVNPISASKIIKDAVCGIEPWLDYKDGKIITHKEFKEYRSYGIPRLEPKWRIVSYLWL